MRNGLNIVESGFFAFHFEQGGRGAVARLDQEIGRVVGTNSVDHKTVVINRRAGEAPGSTGGFGHRLGRLHEIPEAAASGARRRNVTMRPGFTTYAGGASAGWAQCSSSSFPAPALSPAPAGAAWVCANMTAPNVIEAARREAFRMRMIAFPGTTASRL